MTNEPDGFQYAEKPLLAQGFIFEKLVRQSKDGTINTLYITRGEDTTMRSGNAEVKCTFKEPKGIEITNFKVEGMYGMVGDEILDNLKQVNNNPRYIEPKLREQARLQMIKNEQRKISRKYHQVMSDLEERAIAIVKMIASKPEAPRSLEYMH